MYLSFNPVLYFVYIKYNFWSNQNLSAPLACAPKEVWPCETSGGVFAENKCDIYFENNFVVTFIQFYIARPHFIMLLGLVNTP